MTAWRWRQEARPGSPDWNMATDAALLSEVRDAAGPPTVRLYFWDRPCVSIGRLQDEAAAQAAYPGLPLVRRPTGGRAVRHGNDLTVSVSACLHHLPLAEESGVLATYHLIAGALGDAFSAVGTPATFGGTRDRVSAGGVDCFAVASRCDIVDRRSGRKLAGCAQRREGRALLQQMSVPLVEIPAVDPFVDCIRRSLAQRLGVSAWESAPTAPENSGEPSTRGGRQWSPGIGR